MLVSVALVVGMLGTASADGIYVYEAFGGTDVHDELAADMQSAFRIRLGVGVRRRNWAVEGWMAGALDFSANTSHGASPSPSCEYGCGYDVPPSHHHDDNDALFTYGLDLKYFAPLSRNIELYVRGGLSRGILSDGHTGNGMGVGAGIQIKGRVPALGLLFWPLFFTDWGPKITAAAFLDNGAEFYRLHSYDGGYHSSIDARLTHLTVGFGFGSDF